MMNFDVHVEIERFFVLTIDWLNWNIIEHLLAM